MKKRVLAGLSLVNKTYQVLDGVGLEIVESLLLEVERNGGTASQRVASGILHHRERLRVRLPDVLLVVVVVLRRHHNLVGDWNKSGRVAKCKIL